MNGAESNPGSLQNLHDVVAPAAVGAWPPAPGWYGVMALAALALLLLAYRLFQHWRLNRYRRAALRQLASLRESDRAGESAAEVAVLLKQTALAAWPRNRVASLSGTQWAAFLASTGATVDVAQRLSAIAYVTHPLSEEDRQRAFADAEHWIRRHRREAA